MDKKKVKELIVHSVLNIDRIVMGDIDGFEASVDIKRWLNEALEELSKSDWVSVEDRLPEFYEKVHVTDKEHRDFVWTSHRENGDSPMRLDNKGFPAWECHYPYYPVTHWKPIEKLEE